MPRLSPEEKLARAQDAKAKAMAELRSAAGQISAKQRKLDTRRKVVLGGLVMSMMKQSPTSNFSVFMTSQIHKLLSERDRALFEDWTPAPPKKKVT